MESRKEKGGCDMELKDEVQKICEKYGAEIDEKAYEFKLGIIEEQRDDDREKAREITYYRELIMEHAVSVNMKLIKNEKGIKVPSWFQEKLDFSYDFYKQKIFVRKARENPLKSKSEIGISDESGDGEEFYKDILPSEVFEIYKVKKVFLHQEAELFAKGEVDAILAQLIKNLNKNEQIDRMSREIYEAVKERYV